MYPNVDVWRVTSGVTEWRETEQTGSRLSFEEYATARQAHLIRLAYLMVRDHHLAQDLAQESLARVYENWRRINADGNPDAYVRKVMLNQLLTWRRRRAWSERPVADLGDQAVADQSAATDDRAAMAVVLGELPMRQRAVIVLRFYEDLDDTAIADILGCSPATVATHAKRALSHLRSAAAAADLVRGGRHDRH
jgi:RNA polymerase sigma-70 factor (sigma-E family)